MTQESFELAWFGWGQLFFGIDYCCVGMLAETTLIRYHRRTALHLNFYSLFSKNNPLAHDDFISES